MAVPSTRGWPFVPFFPPAARIRAGGFAAEGGLRHGPIHRLPAPGDPLQVVILSQAGPPHVSENAGPLPLLEAEVHRAATAVLAWDGLPLTAGPQHVQDARQHGSVGHPRAAAHLPPRPPAGTRLC